MTPAQGAAHLARIAAKLRRNVERAEADTVREAYARARTLSQGPFDAGTLAQMGHPYARRDPRPPADPALINLQSGAFDAGWQVRLPQWQGDNLHTEIRNESRAAGYLDQGTRTMIARPLVDRVLQSVAPQRLKRLTAAIRRALT